MSVIGKLREMVPTGDEEPNTYECPECGRRFEVNAPPERVVCSECGHQDLGEPVA